MSAGDAEGRLFDRGYRPYEGPRHGVGGAVRSLALHSARWALGLRRAAWAKVVPLLSAAIAFVPAAVFIGLAAMLPERVLDLGLLPSPGEYYTFVTSAILLFTAFVAPELLCADRRSGLLALYLASPLDRDTYLLAKALAVTGVLSVVTLGPPLLLLVAFSLVGRGPEGVAGFALALLRVLAAGVAVTALHVALSMAAAAVADRRAVASAAVVLVVLVTSAVTSALMEAGAADWLFLANLLALPFELALRIHGEEGGAPALPTAAVAAANLAWTVAAGGLVRLRYHRLAVTR